MRRAVILICSLLILAAMSLSAWALVHRTSLTRTRYPQPVLEMSCKLRAALGYGPHDMAVFGATAETYGDVAYAAAVYCDEHQQTLAPLIAVVDSARRNVVRAYELNEDVTTREATWTAAIDALAAGCGAAVDSMNAQVAAPQRALRVRRMANRLLDPELATLDLQPAQRDALVAARRARDLVHLHHSKRKDLPVVKQAQDDFEAAVAGQLTGEQRTALASAATARDAILSDLLSADEAMLGNANGL